LFVNNAKESFKKFKVELNENTEKTFSKDNPQLAQEAMKKYGTIVLEEQTKKFDWGFDKLFEDSKKEIFDYVTVKEEQIREIRNDYWIKLLHRTVNKNR